MNEDGIFLTIWLVGLIFVLYGVFSLTRSDFWVKMKAHFSYSGSLNDFPKSTSRSERIYFREPDKKWNTWNLFKISMNEQGIFISNIMPSVLFPKLFIPWKEVELKEVKWLKLGKRVILTFQSYDGELAVSYKHHAAIRKSV